MTSIKERGYANENCLVSTEWLHSNLDDPNIRIIESNEDQLLYPSGHIPGAVEVDWTLDLNDPLRRDYLDQKQFESLASRIGITKESILVFYGDKSNWWACYAFWVFKLFGHANLKILDGGRLKWIKENRTITKEKPKHPTTRYSAPKRDDSVERVFRDQVLEHSNAGLPLVDVRSPEEYSGERLHMQGYPNEGALRGGHIPGAHSVPWARAVNPEDGTFKNADELRQIYEKECGLSSGQEIIAYCRIGERSSLTWFVLRHLLGYEKVRNYDGSWTEWGNLVGVPIEREL
jgi:thiosulfate/3-mercaptopyruvate sulfurtransferase